MRITGACQSILDCFIGKYFHDYRMSVKEVVSDHQLDYFCSDISHGCGRKKASAKRVKYFYFPYDEGVLNFYRNVFKRFFAVLMFLLFRKSLSTYVITVKGNIFQIDF